MVAYNVVLNKAINLWVRGACICIKLPIKTLHVLWETQLFFIFLPFRCANRIFHLILPDKPKNPEKLLKTIMCCDVDDTKKVMSAFHTIQTTSLSAINKLHTLNVEKEHRELIGNDEVQSIPHESIPLETISDSDAGTDHVELINSERTNTPSNEKFCISEKDSCASLPIISGKPSENCVYEHVIAMSIQKFLQSYFDGLRKQAAEIREMKSRCPDVVNHSNAGQSVYEIFNDSLFNFPVGSISATKTPGGIDKLQTITRLLNVENSQLKEHLKLTNDQFNDVRTATMCLSQKVLNLELQLNQVKDILRDVSCDRDTMQKKLLILQQMIEEEEIYLNDGSSRDDSYNDLYVTAQNYNFHNLEASSPLENQSIYFTEPDK